MVTVEISNFGKDLVILRHFPDGYMKIITLPIDCLEGLIKDLEGLRKE